MLIKYGVGEKETTIEDLQATVGPGWSDIIRRLVNDLFDLGWNGTVLQVKEKFGGLRFYIPDPDPSDVLDNRINAANQESYRTCESCGKPGVLRAGNWIKTLCEIHAAGRLEIEL